MTLSETCQCGTENHGSQPEPAGNGLRKITFECDECRATGVVTTHIRAGIMGRSGSYFGDE